MKNTETNTRAIVVSTDTLSAYKKSFVSLVVVLTVFIIVVFVDDDVRMVFQVTDPIFLGCMETLCLYVVYTIIVDYQQIKVDIKIVEDLEADSSRINMLTGEIPLETNQEKSLFVKNYAILSRTDRKISSFRITALREEYFRVNGNIRQNALILVAMGIIGTVIGLSKGLAGMTAGDESAEQLMAYAFSTTILAGLARIVIIKINKKLEDKKKSLFNIFLDIIYNHKLQLENKKKLLSNNLLDTTYSYRLQTEEKQCLTD